jgi:hypothetical protein
MNGLPIASLMAREAVRSKLTGPQPEPRTPHRARRAAAIALQAIAHRLDPSAAAPSRPQTSR